MSSAYIYQWKNLQEKQALKEENIVVGWGKKEYDKDGGTWG
jgi:hypothetical protein